MVFSLLWFNVDLAEMMLENVVDAVFLGGGSATGLGMMWLRFLV